MDRVQRQGLEGYQLAYVAEGDVPVACIGFRRQERLTHGPLFYVDDLITLPRVRSNGYGAQLLDWVEALAREEGRRVVDLDSGTERERAHRFYFRQGYHIAGYHFVKRLEQSP